MPVLLTMAVGILVLTGKTHSELARRKNECKNTTCTTQLMSCICCIAQHVFDWVVGGAQTSAQLENVLCLEGKHRLSLTRHQRCPATQKSEIGCDMLITSHISHVISTSYDFLCTQSRSGWSYA